VLEDFDRCYRAVKSRDARFDGWLFTAVTSTGIYCRPSCAAVTPKAENVRFYATAAAAQQAGFRACLRCRPDASPGSPEWLGRADVAARAVKLILDGTVDREGVSGLARRLGYSERRLHRVLVAEVGSGALALARAQRAQTARVLLGATELPIAEVALAAGFASVRQFNETVRTIFARTPSELRRRDSGKGTGTGTGTGTGAASNAASDAGTQRIALRLAYRRPLAAKELLDFLALRALPGIEAYDGSTYRRSLRLPHGAGTVAISVHDGELKAVFALEDMRDLMVAVARCRHLLDLDSDPQAVAELLGADPLLGHAVARTPGLRMPGAADGFEIAVRAVIGQQISLSAARTVAGKLARAAGTPLTDPMLPVTHVFPSPERLAELARKRPEAFAMPASRRRTLGLLSEAIAAGDLSIDAGSDPTELRRKLLAIAGIGPWTADYIALRALADPDAFLPTDLGVRHALARLAQIDSARAIGELAEAWRPWRAYAQAYLWHGLSHAVPVAGVSPTNMRASAA
jgi:AraC family transcriptional regulator, regulatory protein of adaptative response / DNA-3-methyladenine glycosylase II